jgi:DNA polymerase-3 subunit delta
MPFAPEAVMKDIQSGKFAPVYVLSGEEAFYIDKVEDALLASALGPGEADFNLDVFYGKEAENKVIDVVNACINYPVFANRRVVLIREAQHLKKDDWDKLESYAKQPASTTILIISHKHKNIDKRTSFSKLVDKSHVLMESPRLKEQQLPDWISRYFQSRSFRLDRDVAEMLAENLGNDLARISNEVEKLELALEKGVVVTKEIIEKYIGISRDYNSFELSNAVQDGNLAKAAKIIDYFGKNPKAGPVPVLIATIYGFFIKLWQVHQGVKEGKSPDAAISGVGVNPYFAGVYKKAMGIYPLAKTERAIHLLAEYDARSKGIDNHATGEAQLMTELIFKIMH